MFKQYKQIKGFQIQNNYNIAYYMCETSCTNHHIKITIITSTCMATYITA